MKQLFMLVGVFAAATSAGWGAAICIPGSLASYVALGPGGCTIGIDTVGSFQTLSGFSPAVPIAPSGIQITPSGSSTSPRLSFQLSATTSAVLEAIFTYRISGNSFTGSSITVSNTSSTGDGGSTDIQNLCGAGAFGSDGVSNCSGTTLGPLVVFGSDNSLTTFAGASFLTVTDDFTLDGGQGGTASGATFVDQFTATTSSAVPEPGTMLITSLASAVLFSFKMRSSKKASAKREIL